VRSPSSIACDRLGLAVWLPRRATVTATIAGSPPIRLDDPHWTYFVRYHGRGIYVYAGFLQPAGLTTRFHIIPKPNTQTWDGSSSNAPSPLVYFRIDYGLGDIVFNMRTSCYDPAGANEDHQPRSQPLAFQACDPSDSATSRGRVLGSRKRRRSVAGRPGVLI
jgi:hypothetical protein